MYTRTRWSALLGIGFLLAACTAPEIPRERFYRLTPLVDPSATPRFDGTVEVGRFDADGLTAQRPLVYTEAASPNQAFAYHYHSWEQVPGVMLQNLMVESLRAAKAGDAVVTPALRVRSDYVVGGRILRLERAVGDGPSSGVLHLELLVRRTSDDALLYQGIYRETATAREPTVAATVAALNIALARILDRFLTDLAAR